MKSLKYLLSLTFVGCSLFASAQMDKLRTEIETYTRAQHAKVGVAVYELEKGDTLTVNNTYRYPMQSVFKFHLALAVLHEVDEGKLSLSQKILVKKEDLKPDTWSPMRKDYPKGNVKLSLAEILTYTVSQSDNNGCDILFRLVGGTEKVNTYIHSLGVTDVSIKGTEEQMHNDWNVQFTNWSTPYAAVQLLQKFFNGHILSDSSHDFLWKIMVNSLTPNNRLKGKLSADVVVAHKTGTSDRNKEGVKAALNDIGIITLPSGHHYAIAVFVSDSKEMDAMLANIIADVSSMTYRFLSKEVKE